MKRIVVREVDCTLPSSLDELREAYDVERYANENGLGWNQPTLSATLSEQMNYGSNAWPEWYATYFNASSREWFLQQFGRHLVTYLSTEHRLQLVKESPSSGELWHTANLLQAFYRSGKHTELSVRSLVRRAFGLEVALDYSAPDQGDGIRSFTGIVVALLAVKRDLILIDEQEAFLHPPQSFRIGEFISDQASESRQIIVATHSVDVLRGILSKSHVDVSIIRLNRIGDANSFQVLAADQLLSLVRDPLLSSARVLDGLFYTGSVVVEADSDARFYQYVSRKLSEDLDLHFVNADSKQTVPRIMKIYEIWEYAAPAYSISMFSMTQESSQVKWKQLVLEIRTCRTLNYFAPA